MGWLIAFGIVTLIAILPIGISAIYDEEGSKAYLLIGPVRILVYPGRKKEKKKTLKTKNVKSSRKSSGTKATKKKKGGSLDDFLPILDLILNFLASFGRKIRVNLLAVRLILAGGDPSDLAVNYGRGWSILGNLIPLLENAFIIKKRDLKVDCDFLADKTTIVVHLDLTITVGRVIALLIVRGIPILRELLKLMKKIKGGAKA